MYQAVIFGLDFVYEGNWKNAMYKQYPLPKKDYCRSRLFPACLGEPLILLSVSQNVLQDVLSVPAVGQFYRIPEY